MRTGVDGLGDMGSGRATDLIAKGFQVTGIDLCEARIVAFRECGGADAGSVAEVAARGDAVPAMVTNGDLAKSAIPGVAGPGIGTRHRSRMISLGLAEELEVPMQMASSEMQISHARHSRCWQEDILACTRVTEEVVCAELHREGAR
ncbi:MAG: NAD(P)-binding domain-containing protein [Boseongicola sp.]|nr:NAD(P)-binding domain-containing protein [Boseongicola sp.]